MTIDTHYNPTARADTLQVNALVQKRQQLEATGGNVGDVDRELLPYKTLYVRAGAIYGGNSAGMVRWFAERELD